MITMEEYKVVDQILPNYLEVGDLIKVKNDVYEVINLNPTPEGWDIIVLDNYEETKTISVPDDKKVNLVLSDEFEG
jgi:signal peptidase I